MKPKTFKVGDKVKVISNSSSAFKNLIGEVIKVKHDYDWDYTLIFKERDGEFGFRKNELDYWYQEINDNVKELYQEFNKKHKFEVGDRVHCYSIKWCGATGIVKDIKLDYLIVELDLADNEKEENAFHYKQCRKLKKKISKNQSMLNDCLYILNCIDGQHNSSGVVQTIEDFRKKYEKKY